MSRAPLAEDRRHNYPTSRLRTPLPSPSRGDSENRPQHVDSYRPDDERDRKAYGREIRHRDDHRQYRNDRHRNDPHRDGRHRDDWRHNDSQDDRQYFRHLRPEDRYAPLPEDRPGRPDQREPRHRRKDSSSPRKLRHLASSLPVAASLAPLSPTRPSSASTSGARQECPTTPHPGTIALEDGELDVDMEMNSDTEMDQSMTALAICPAVTIEPPEDGEISDDSAMLDGSVSSRSSDGLAAPDLGRSGSSTPLSEVTTPPSTVPEPPKSREPTPESTLSHTTPKGRSPEPGPMSSIIRLPSTSPPSPRSCLKYRTAAVPGSRPLLRVRFDPSIPPARQSGIGFPVPKRNATVGSASTAATGDLSSKTASSSDLGTRATQVPPQTATPQAPPPPPGPPPEIPPPPSPSPQAPPPPALQTQHPPLAPYRVVRKPTITGNIIAWDKDRRTVGAEGRVLATHVFTVRIQTLKQRIVQMEEYIAAERKFRTWVREHEAEGHAQRQQQRRQKASSSILGIHLHPPPAAPPYSFHLPNDPKITDSGRAYDWLVYAGQWMDGRNLYDEGEIARLRAEIDQLEKSKKDMASCLESPPHPDAR